MPAWHAPPRSSNKASSAGAASGHDACPALQRAHAGAAANPANSFDVVLTGADLTLGFDATPDPSINVWNAYSVPLDEAAAWRVTTKVSEAGFKDFATLAVPTADQMRAVLGDLTRLLIRGEFETGPDEGSLDNVRMGAAE